jgi:acyl carrier protein
MRRLKQILSKVFGINENEITDETSPDNVQTWDSFNGLMLVSELEKKFNVHFTMDEVTSVKCVRDIKESLKKHGVNLDESG